MPMTARLQLEALDGRWLPDATQAASPPLSPALVSPLPPTNAPIPPTLAQDPKYLDSLELLRAAVQAVNDTSWTFAYESKNVAESDARVVAIEYRIAQVLAAGESGAAERAELVAELRFGNAARLKVQKATADHPVLVAAVNGLAAAINARYSTNLAPILPALDAYVDIVTTGDLPTQPPAGGNA